jgi:hypothetical protein
MCSKRMIATSLICSGGGGVISSQRRKGVT